jgi:uncharacterized protein
MGMGMYRLIDGFLDSWRDHSLRKPLIVRGARQVGKTYSLLSLGRRAFDSTVHIDFERNPEFCSVFEGELDPRKIVDDLELLKSTRIWPGETLLFLDEIQACPRAITALRYFKEEMPELHVVAAGSLLEFALRDISFPVGRIQFYEMVPMTFEEYLGAVGSERAVEIVSQGPQAISQVEHSFLLKSMSRYCRVGGMPEAVCALVETGSLVETGRIHLDIINAYRADFAKYAPRADKTCLAGVMSTVADSVGERIKYSRLVSGFANPTIHRAFDLLCEARIIRKVRASSPAGLPLSGHASEKIFKAVFLDVGLMQTINGMRPEVDYSPSDLLDVHRGSVAEQFVGQELFAATEGDLFHWARQKRGSTAEVDYMVAQGTEVVPIEVKSGSTGRMKSLQILLNEVSSIRRAWVLSSAPLSPPNSRGVQRLPIYFAYSAVKAQ